MALVTLIYIVIFSKNTNIPAEYIIFYKTEIEGIVTFRKSTKSEFVFEINSKKLVIPMAQYAGNESTLYFEERKIKVGDSVFKQKNNDTLFVKTKNKIIPIISAYSSDYYYQ